MLSIALPLIAFLIITFVTAATIYVVRSVFGERLMTIEQRFGMNANTSTLPLEIPPPAPRNLADRFDRWFSELIVQAGIDLDPPAAFLAVVASGLLLGGVSFLWSENPIVGFSGWLVGAVLVMFVFLYRGAQRRRKTEELFPDAVDLMARAVRAGESLDQAVETVATSISEPLASEFARFSGQLKMGLSVNAATGVFSRRVPIPESRILAATLVVQRRAGGNLPVTLERLAKVCIDRLSYQRQHRVATAMARGSAALIVGFTIVVVVYIAVFRPSITEQLMSRQGLLLMTTASILQVVGLFWICQLLRSDY